MIQTTCTPCTAGCLQTLILQKIPSVTCLETPDFTFLVGFLFIKQTCLMRGEVKLI